MPIPIVRGLIDRRILVNFRVDPAVLERALPHPFRPTLVGGYGVAGICLIRLKQIRPRFLPPALGLSSENAAHRIAVQWEQNGRLQQGVYIPRRDTSSWINCLAGGRLFPGAHYHARFKIKEGGGRFRIEMRGNHPSSHLVVDGSLDPHWPNDSVFRSPEAASAFFQRGSQGYSATGRAGVYDGVELRTHCWETHPLAIHFVESAFFEDGKMFPPGSVQFDCALLMQGIQHEWHGLPVLACPSRVLAASAG